METWFIIIISLCISALLKSVISVKKSSTTHRHRLPPGPFSLPFIGSFLFLIKSFSQLESILRNLHAKYGPLVTLRIGSRPAIFVADRSLAHYALVQNGALFSDRPPVPPTTRILTGNKHNINSSVYGPTWRLLRRNLTSEILHPAQLKSYSGARKWVLEILRRRLGSQSQSNPIHHFQYAMFCLLVLMCFGDKLGENQIEEIKEVEVRLLLRGRRFNFLNFWPRLSKILFRKRWKELLQLRKDREDVLIPYIRARKERKDKKNKDDDEFVTSYVDTLLDLELPDERRKLDEEEMVTLCSEFLIAGTDTTSTALQWIMANLVKYPHIQERLVREIKGVVEAGAEEVGEEDLHKMPYLKAVILEGLRRHPPAHFVLPHSVREDVLLDGYLVPKNATINFMVAEMGWDPKVWEDPMAFKPERFLSSDDEINGFDITASREIKMMPFGAGRRICPAYGLAMLHLEYFVANLIWNFVWKKVEGDDVDLSEKQGLTVVMKNPLQAHISPRLKYKEKRCDSKRMLHSGGMPSSHSATVTALAVAVGLQEGTGRPVH